MYQIEMQVSLASGGGRKRKVLLPIFFNQLASAESAANRLSELCLVGDVPSQPNYATYAEFRPVPVKTKGGTR